MSKPNEGSKAVELGKVNRLTVLRSTAHGLFLDGGRLGEILLPKRYIKNDMEAGSKVDVFLMRDSEERLVATTQYPKAMVGEFAFLQVKQSTGVGAFLDWGMPKDLLVPFREQRVSMKEGQSYVVYIYLDRVSDRIAATSKLDKFLDREPPTYKAAQEVDLLIVQRTDLGFKAIVNGKHWGMLFNNEIIGNVQRGDRMKGFIRQVRSDLKIDLCLHRPGYAKVTDSSKEILQYLKDEGGFMPVTDKNSADEIFALFGISKKTYKKAIGALYKKRLIIFEDGGTRLVEKK